MVFAAVGSVNEYLIGIDKLKSYALSYLPSVFSLTYNNVNQPLPIKLFASVSTTVVSNAFLNYFAPTYLQAASVIGITAGSLVATNENEIIDYTVGT